MKSLFKTQTNQLFLHLVDNGNNMMLLRATLVDPIEEIPFPDLFSYIEVNFNTTIQLTASGLSNKIAQKTRHSIANIIFVPNEHVKSLLVDHPRKFKIVVVDFLKDDEIGATYWNNEQETFAALYGGVQYFDDKVSYNPSYQNYFLKAKFK